MKILLVAERYWPEVGAAPSRLANMAEGLKEQGAEVDVLTSLPNYPKGRIYEGYRGHLSMKEVVNGCNVFRYWIYATVSQNPIARIVNMFSFALMIWLFAFKRKRIKNYDHIIIQTPTLVVGVSAMILFRGIYRKKCIINVSDIWPSTAVDMGVMREGSTSYKFMHWCEKYLYRKCDGVLGQSQEILDHIITFPHHGPLFLYRNLQRYRLDYEHKTKDNPLKIVFCGMLGVAQDVLGIVEGVDFKKLGVEFHILGGGKQLEAIQDFCRKHPDCNVYAHGYVPKEEIAQRIRAYHASIIPLATRIRGAVPSKLYDTLPQGLPILFCGGGEGAQFITERNIGLISEPGDYASLTSNITKLRDMGDKEYEDMSSRCIHVSKEELDFDKQMRACYQFLLSI